MKKVLLVAVAAAFIGSSAMAQDVMKQTGGENNVEVLFSPLGGNPIGINGIKYRKFTSATTAIRGTVFLGFNSSKDLSTDFDGTELRELEATSNEFNFSIAPGIERHFVGTDRLSPYYGAEVILGFATMRDAEEQLSLEDPADITIVETETTNGSLTFGANAFAGVDYYFADNIYLGFEFGFGLAFTTNFDTTTSTSGREDVETPNGNSFNVGLQ